MDDTKPQAVPQDTSLKERIAAGRAVIAARQTWLNPDPDDFKGWWARTGTCPTCGYPLPCTSDWNAPYSCWPGVCQWETRVAQKRASREKEARDRLRSLLLRAEKASVGGSALSPDDELDLEHLLAIFSVPGGESGQEK